MIHVVSSVDHDDNDSSDNDRRDDDGCSDT